MINCLKAFYTEPYVLRNIMFSGEYIEKETVSDKVEFFNLSNKVSKLFA